MAIKARKFKKKLASKPTRKKADPILSVQLVKKDTLDKLTEIWKKLISKFKSFKLAN